MSGLDGTTECGWRVGSRPLDTSAWIEYLRGTGSPVHVRLRAAVADGEDISVLDVVRLELLAGARDERQERKPLRFLGGFQAVPASSPADHELAAALYRAARQAGQSVRSLLDCLVAAGALHKVIGLGQPPPLADETRRRSTVNDQLRLRPERLDQGDRREEHAAHDGPAA